MSLKGLKKLEKTMLKTKKIEHESSITQLKRLHQALYPDGVAQERMESAIPYLAFNGHAFIGALKEQLKPLSKGVLIIKHK